MQLFQSQLSASCLEQSNYLSRQNLKFSLGFFTNHFSSFIKMQFLFWKILKKLGKRNCSKTFVLIFTISSILVIQKKLFHACVSEIRSISKLIRLSAKNVLNFYFWIFYIKICSICYFVLITSMYVTHNFDSYWVLLK